MPATAAAETRSAQVEFDRLKSEIRRELEAIKARRRSMTDAEEITIQAKMDRLRSIQRQVRSEDPAGLLADLERLREQFDGTEPAWNPRKLPFFVRRQAEATAYHETGHAVIAYLEGRTVNEVRLKVAWERRDGWQVLGGACRSEGSTALGLVAGQAAERHFRDEVRAYGEPWPLPEHSRRDDERAEKLAKKAGLPLSEYRRRAATILGQAWPAVRAVATELVEEIRLDGARVGEIIEQELTPELIRNLRRAAW